jgi:TLD
MVRCFGPKVGRKNDVSTSRTKSPSRGSVRKGKPNDAIAYGPLEDSVDPRRSRSLEQPRPRAMQENHLDGPYELNSRAKTFSPQNGQVIKPLRAPSKQSLNSSGETSRTDEIFRPQVGNRTRSINPPPAWRTAAGSRGSPSVQSSKPAHHGRGSFAIEPAGSQDYLDRQSPHHDPSARYAHKSSHIAEHPGADLVKKDPQPDSWGLPSLLSSAMEDNEDEKDRLSDVASDVDSVARDSYILACQMLKSAVTEKQRVLQPQEKEFILRLLGDVDDKVGQDNDVTVPRQDGISAKERSALLLGCGPLIQSQQEKLFPSGELTAGDSQRQEHHNRTSPASYQTEEINTKHPHTATRIKPKDILNILSTACGPNHLADVGYRDHDIDENDHASGGEGEATARVKKGLIRFNGWDFYKPLESSFRILGRFDPKLPRVLTPYIMENLRGFFPIGAGESNFWLKFNLVRDVASLSLLLDSVRYSKYTIIGVETRDGEVFGSFTSTRWRTGTRWFGSRDAFLWRLKKSRYTMGGNPANYENEMEVYPFTGSDQLVQYCTHKTIAVGGGEWVGGACPFPTEPRGIGFMIDGDLVGGETNSCATFANPPLCRKTSASNEFSIANVEVWTLTPCLNVHDAATMEYESTRSTKASF